VAVIIFVFGENVGEENVDVGRVLDGRPVDSAVVGENVGRNVGVLDGRSVDSVVVGENVGRNVAVSDGRSVDSVGRNVGRNVGVSDGRSVDSVVVVGATKDGNSTISGMFTVGRSISISISISSAGCPEEESRGVLVSVVGNIVGKNVGMCDGTLDGTMDGLLDGNLVWALAARKLGAKGASILPAADDGEDVGSLPPQSDESSADVDDEGSSPQSVRESVVCRDLCLGLGLWVGVGVGLDLADFLALLA